MKRKILQIFIIILGVILVAPMYKVNAISLKAVGNTAVGEQFFISLSATPPASNITNVQISLEFVGSIEVLDYIPPETAGWGPEIGTCPGNTTHTQNSLCVDLSNSSGITQNDSLGNILVRRTGAAIIQIMGLSDNGYITSGDFTSIIGELLNIDAYGNISGGIVSSNTELPVTNIDAKNTGALFGTTLIFLGLSYIAIIKNNLTYHTIFLIIRIRKSFSIKKVKKKRLFDTNFEKLIQQYSS